MVCTLGGRRPRRPRASRSATVKAVPLLCSGSCSSASPFGISVRIASMSTPPWRRRRPGQVAARGAARWRVAGLILGLARRRGCGAMTQPGGASHGSRLLRGWGWKGAARLLRCQWAWRPPLHPSKPGSAAPARPSRPCRGARGTGAGSRRQPGLPDEAPSGWLALPRAHARRAPGAARHPGAAAAVPCPAVPRPLRAAIDQSLVSTPGETLAPPPQPLGRAGPRTRVPWADLLKKVFAVDVMECPGRGEARPAHGWVANPQSVVFAP